MEILNGDCTRVLGELRLDAHRNGNLNELQVYLRLICLENLEVTDEIRTMGRVPNIFSVDYP